MIDLRQMRRQELAAKLDRFPAGRTSDDVTEKSDFEHPPYTHYTQRPIVRMRERRVFVCVPRSPLSMRRR